MWWTDDKIRWYSQASKDSNFHQELTKLLLPYVQKEDKIVELGSGLGYITDRLNHLGYSATGYDIDKKAIEFAISQFGPHYSVQDCLESVPQSDICLAVFFGHFREVEFLNRVLESTKRLIIVSNLHSQFKTRKHKELTELFTKLGLYFEQFKGEIPFHQPFSSYDDALCFIEAYYPNDKEKVVNNLKMTKDGYLLENNKNFIITIIEGRRKN